MTRGYIHDHFDGSAHCVECGGTCQLGGAERTATELVRWLCEQRARVGHGLNMLEAATIRGAGADPDALLNRAVASERAFKQAADDRYQGLRRRAGS